MKTRMMTALLSLFLAVGLVSASVTTTQMAQQIADGLCQFKILVIGILPTLALILFLFAGLAYAAGQAFGAETKAKAQGWAMSLLVGGIIGIILAVLAPILVNIFISMTVGMTVSSAC
ncbi:MAG: hypothetical protein NTY73_02790 [Candidatus Micrarchaeota archaeon]|nr:hypothetical protein [Candidatus Micrarchaeota archaeon]